MAEVIHAISDTEREQIKQLRNQGVCYKDIAQQVGCSFRRVESVCQQYAARVLVETRCFDCQCVIKQWIRPHDPRFYRCARCAARIWAAVLKERAVAGEGLTAV